jgi:hypothetical protein
MTTEPNWTGEEIVTFTAREYLVDEPLSANLSVNVKVQNVNDPPTIDAVFPSSILEDETFAIDLLVSDPDPTEDVLEYELVTEHSFLMLDEETGIIRGLPTNDDVGIATVNIDVRDGNGGGASRSFVLEVVNVNDGPMITTGDQLLCYEDALYRVDYDAEDVDPTKDILTWDMVTDAPFLTCDWATGVVEGTPAQADMGTYSVLLTVSDGRGASNSTRFDLEVVAVDDAPIVIEMDTFTVVEDDASTLDLEPYIDDADTPLDRLVLGSDHPAVVATEGFEITLLYLDSVGTDQVEFTVSDGTSSTTGWFSVKVQAVNDLPRLLTIGGYTDPWEIFVLEGHDVNLTIIVHDVDSALVDISLESEWGHLSLDGDTLNIDAPRDTVLIRDAALVLDDQHGGVVRYYFSVRVINENDPPGVPVIMSPLNHTRFYIGDRIMLKVDIDDADLIFGQVLSITWSSDLAGELIAYDSAHGEDVFITDLGLGDHIITVTVYDGEFTRSNLVRVIVEEVPQPDVEEEGTSMGLLVGLVVGIVLVVVIALLIIRRRSAESVDDQADGESGPEPSDKGEASMEEIPPPPVTHDEAVEAIRGLPRALPPDLWAYDIEELASMVIEAPSGQTPDGLPLMEIDGKWYMANAKDYETFLAPWSGEVVR